MIWASLNGPTSPLSRASGSALAWRASPFRVALLDERSGRVVDVGRLGGHRQEQLEQSAVLEVERHQSVERLEGGYPVQVVPEIIRLGLAGPVLQDGLEEALPAAEVL